MTTRRITRKQRHSFTTDPLITHAMTAGVFGVGGLAIGMHACDKLVTVLETSRHFLIDAGLTVIGMWLIVCLIRAIATSVQHVWQLQQAKAFYREQGYELVDGVLFLNGEKVNV